MVQAALHPTTIWNQNMHCGYSSWAFWLELFLTVAPWELLRCAQKAMWVKPDTVLWTSGCTALMLLLLWLLLSLFLLLLLLLLRLSLLLRCAEEAAPFRFQRPRSLLWLPPHRPHWSTMLKTCRMWSTMWKLVILGTRVCWSVAVSSRVALHYCYYCFFD